MRYRIAAGRWRHIHSDGRAGEGLSPHSARPSRLSPRAPLAASHRAEGEREEWETAAPVALSGGEKLKERKKKSAKYTSRSGSQVDN